MQCSIVPPYLLARIAEGAEKRALGVVARAARRALAETGVLLTARRQAVLPVRGDDVRGDEVGTGAPVRTIADAESTETLPGVVVRREGEQATGDPAADEAYDGLGATFALFHDVYGRNSINGRGGPLDTAVLDATVHYGEEYDNAFWDGSRMVFGDGDGEIFRRFTVSLSAIGHELAHGVTQYAADLRYSGQSGALAESLSDVFGALVEQRTRDQDAAGASWLIGEGLFTDAVRGVALRSMAAPGTAYDDPLLGTDPQPAHLDFFVDTAEDDGGVHINSGIPNRAFALAAQAIGGRAWAGVGRVWYLTLTRGGLSPDAGFAEFATATVSAATAHWGRASRERAAVADAWRTVGVEP